MGFIPENFNWQTMIAFAIVALAIGVLVRKAWNTIFGDGENTGCGTGCGSCPANGTESSTSLKVTPLVQLKGTDSLK